MNTSLENHGLELRFKAGGNHDRGGGKRSRGSAGRCGKSRFIVKHHPCKRRSKFYGAVSLERAPAFTFRKAERFNSRTYQTFLEAILDRHEKVCLVLDNVMYHRAKRLAPFLEANKDRLWIFHLPPYSPELNLDCTPFSGLSEQRFFDPEVNYEKT